jgi:predicted DNA-binding transcriptional regulator YafY
MATNKNAMIRYKILDSCFRNVGRRFFMEDLIAECEKVLAEIDPDRSGISRRQIFEDIVFMESKEGWSIELERHREGKKVYYRYRDPSFSINNMPFSALEISQLRSALDMLGQFKGMPQFEWVKELLPKLQQGMPAESEPPTIIEFDSNPFLRGLEFLGYLYQAILYKRVLSIRYQGFDDDEPREFIVHPYFLKEFNNRWFLFGYHPDRQLYNWTLALDRMLAIRETQEDFQENDQIDWAEYFEDIIGVTKPANSVLEHVVLRFFGKACRYIETKPLHGSQKSKWLDEQTLEVQLKVIRNYELEGLILSYADSVQVIQPQSLAEAVRNRLLEASRQYHRADGPGSDQE